MSVSVVAVDYINEEKSTAKTPLIVRKIVNGDIPTSQSILQRLAEIGFTNKRTLTAKNTFAHRYDAACVIQSACDRGVIVVVPDQQNRDVNNNQILHARIVTSSTKQTRVQGAVAVVEVGAAHSVALPGSTVSIRPIAEQASRHLEVSENAINHFRSFAATVFLDDPERARLICRQEAIQRKVMQVGVFFWVSAVFGMVACIAQTFQLFTDCTKNSSNPTTPVHCPVYFAAAVVGVLSAAVSAAAFSYRLTLVRCAASLVSLIAGAIGAALTADFSNNVATAGAGPLFAVAGASAAWFGVGIVMLASVAVVLTLHEKVYHA